MTRLLNLKAIGQLVGVRYSTMRNYQQNSVKHRRLAAELNDPSYIRPGDLPLPDSSYRRQPLWEPATVKRWIENRPGQGAGGGRPRKNTAAGGDGVRSENSARG